VFSASVMGRVAAAMLLAAAAAPAHAALFGDDVARKAVADQQKRVDGLYSRYDELAARMAKLEDALKAQAAQTAAAAQPVFEFGNQLQALREEIRSLRGQIEVVSNNIEANAKRQRDMYVDLDTRLRRFEQAPPPAPPAPGAQAPAPGGAASPGGASAAASATAGASAEETKAYEAAQQHRKVGNYQAAVTAFQAFVGQHAKSPLAHRAQYWIGDSYFNLRDYKNAIASQQKLISTYPDSASVPDALLNMASAYIELGDSAAAKKTMDSLVSRFPATDAAEKARRRLASLR
jgi:tol-pal system protein YbgF